jgi:hypothetical protein
VNTAFANILIYNEPHLRRVSYIAGNRLMGGTLSKIRVFDRLRSSLCLIAPSLPLPQDGSDWRSFGFCSRTLPTMVFGVI